MKICRLIIILFITAITCNYVTAQRPGSLSVDTAGKTQQNPDTINKHFFNIQTGANIDFFDGLSASNLSGEAELFTPDIFSLFGSGKRFGLDLGLYENKAVTFDSAASPYLVRYRSTFIPDDSGNVSVTTEAGTKTSSTEIRNLGAYACLLYRLGNGSNNIFRCYAELTYELIRRRSTITNTFTAESSAVNDQPDSSATVSTANEVKVPVIVKVFSEEYLSLGIQHSYMKDDFEYSGEILFGFFSSPLEAYNKSMFNHQNLFYNATFNLTYKKTLSISGEIRHLDFTNKNSKDPYFIVTLSKIIPLENAYNAISSLLAPGK